MRIRLPVEQLLVETFSVVLGILVALAVNDWREAREHAQLAAQVVARFEREIADNDSALALRAPYHRAMADSLGALVQRSAGRAPAGGLHAIRNWAGTRPTLLRSAAWESALATQALSYLDYGTVADLSRLYEQQRRVQAIATGYIGVMYTPSFQTGGFGSIASLFSFLEDLAANEAGLHLSYQAELRALERVQRH